MRKKYDICTSYFTWRDSILFFISLYNGINYSQCLIWIDVIPRSYQQKSLHSFNPNVPSLECVHLFCEVGSVGILPSSVLFLELGLSSTFCWKEGKGAYQCNGNDWDQGMQQFLSGSPVSVPHNGLHTRKRTRIHHSHQIKATSQPIVSRAKTIANLGGEKKSLRKRPKCTVKNKLSI